MGKFAEFMDKVMADETARAEFDAAIGVRKERELTDDDFQKIVGLSEKLGAAVTLDEVKDFFTGNGRELSEEELAGVAGGQDAVIGRYFWRCPYCYETLYFTFFIWDTDDGATRHVKQRIEDHLRYEHKMDEMEIEEIVNRAMMDKGLSITTWRK